MFKKLKNLAVLAFFIVNVFSIFAYSAGSSDSGFSIANPATVIKEFNEGVLDAITDQFLKNPLLRFNSDGSGLVSVIFYACFLISFVNALKSVGPEMMPKLLDLAVYTFIASALLGGPAYKSAAGMFPFTHKTVKHPTGSLDRDIFYWLQETMNKVSEAAFGTENDMRMKLFNASLASTRLSNRMIKARIECPLIDGHACMATVIKTGELPPEKKDEGWGIFNPVKPFLGPVFTILSQIYNPFSWFFPILFWIVEFIRAAFNVFLLIGFGLMTVFAFFLTKLFVPFLLIPSLRGSVIRGLKFPLSIALWGILTNLITYMSISIYVGMEASGTKIMLNMLGGGNFDPSTVYSLMIAMLLTQFVLIAIQIMALFKIPKLAEDILNLSMSSVVAFGGELFSAAGGMVKALGMLAVPAAGMMGSAMGGAAKVAGGAISGAKEGAMGAIGGDKISAMRNKFSSSSPKTSSASSAGSSGISGSGASASGSPLAKANKESVKSSYDDYKNSKSDSKSSSGSASPEPKGPSKLAGLKSLGKAVGAELGGMALDAATGKTDFSDRIIKGAGVAGNNLKSASDNISKGADIARDKTKNAVSGSLKRFEKSTTQSRSEAQGSVAKTMVEQKELVGEDLQSYQNLQTKMENGDELSSEDTDVLTSLQNNNLNTDQKTVVSKAINQQYDKAAKDGDFESLMKLSNNSNADSKLQKKNELNKKNMKGYSQAITKFQSQVSELKKQAVGNSNLASTVDSQKQLSEMVSSGLVNKDVFKEKQLIQNPNSSNPMDMIETSVFEKTKSEEMEQISKDMEEILSNKSKTSADYDTLHSMASDNKFKIKDESLQSRIQESLKEGGVDFNFGNARAEASRLDKDIMDSGYSRYKQSTKNQSISVGSSSFNMVNGNLDTTSGFVNKKNETVSDLSRFSKEDMKRLNDEINLYEKFFVDYNKKIQENPELIEKHSNSVSQMKLQFENLNKIKSAIESSKK